MQVLLVIFRNETGDQKVIDVGVTALQALQHLIDKSSKCLGAFLRPKGILTNSKRPKDVMTAVLGTSAGSTGIWW